VNTKVAVEETTTDAFAPLVTIVILNHNYAEFVERCIHSVDRQDYPHIQCLVLECGSNDDSLSVIGAALSGSENSFFQLLRRDTNQGQVTNYLSALDEIRGDFVTFLDADDFLFPKFVSTHVKAHLNDLCSAALSVTDQIQVNAAGHVLAGTCHWHQKYRALEAGSGWVDVTHARSWNRHPPYKMEQLDISVVRYVPAWWSSWLMDRWIWSAMSGIMFRKSVVTSLVPAMELSTDLRDLSMDSYFARFAHSVGGTLVIDSAQGGYRRHGRNVHSGNPVLGGQTPNGSRDLLEKFSKCQRVARQTLVTKHREFLDLLGGELYYSIAWQLMSNHEFLEFAKNYAKDRDIWEKTFKAAGAARPDLAAHSGPPYTERRSNTQRLKLRGLASLASTRSGLVKVVRRVVPTPKAEALAMSLHSSLSEGQRSEICLEWDHQDPERGLVRRFIANHWQVTRPVIASDFFSSRQRALLIRLFRSLLDPAWEDSFIQQISDDTGGHEWGRDLSVAFFGDPRSGPWQFALTGRHLTLRTGSRQSQVFGGPILYGHAATGFWEKSGHPGNVFWPQAKAASKLYEMLDGAQRKMAEVDRLHEEPEIGFHTTAVGLSARLLSPVQRKQLDVVLQSLAAPFRASDRARIADCLARQGGLDVLRLAFGRANRMSAPDWDDWRLQGPSFVWHWRGAPHVHVWVNVGDDPSEPVNARSGAYIFPEHDPLQF
jgi:glycosyltransferase involved in cell wall biosynthesis